MASAQAGAFIFLLELNGAAPLRVGNLTCSDFVRHRIDDVPLFP